MAKPSSARGGAGTEVLPRLNLSPVHTGDKSALSLTLPSFTAALIQPFVAPALEGKHQDSPREVPVAQGISVTLRGRLHKEIRGIQRAASSPSVICDTTSGCPLPEPWGYRVGQAARKTLPVLASLLLSPTSEPSFLPSCVAPVYFIV